MTNPFYVHNDNVPPAQTRGSSSSLRAEFDLIQAGFDGLSTYAWTFASFTVTTAAVTGVLSIPTPLTNINTTQAVNAAWVNAYYAPLLNPNFSGIPQGPTAAPGTLTNQFATCAFVAAASFNVTIAGVTHVLGTAANAAAGSVMSCENVAATVITANPNPTDNEEFAVMLNNLLQTNSVDFGTKVVKGWFGTLNIAILDLQVITWRFKFMTSLNYWVVL